MLMSIGEKCSKEGSEEVNLRTLEMLAEVVAIPDLHLLWREDAASVGDEGSATPKVPCSTPTVWMFWEERIKLIVENHRERVWQACTRGLRQQHAVVEATKAPSKSWNAWSYRRSAIEAHEQDERGDRSMRDVLIDGARDAMEQAGEAAQADRKTWERLVEICAGEASPVLRRLAIHAVTETTHWTDEEKMRWWVSEKVCNDPWLRHEAYRLVKKAWRNATHETREDAAAAIRRMSPTTSKRRRQGQVRREGAVRPDPLAGRRHAGARRAERGDGPDTGAISAVETKGSPRLPALVVRWQMGRTEAAQGLGGRQAGGRVEKQREGGDRRSIGLRSDDTTRRSRAVDEGTERGGGERCDCGDCGREHGVDGCGRAEAR